MDACSLGRRCSWTGKPRQAGSRSVRSSSRAVLSTTVALVASLCVRKQKHELPFTQPRLPRGQSSFHLHLHFLLNGEAPEGQNLKFFVKKVLKYETLSLWLMLPYLNGPMQIETRVNIKS